MRLRILILTRIIEKDINKVLTVLRYFVESFANESNNSAPRYCGARYAMRELRVHESGGVCAGERLCQAGRRN